MREKVSRISGRGDVAADADPQALREHPATALAPLVHVALALSDVAKLTGRKEPTVIT